MPSFMDTFHKFMQDRYQISVVAQKATHDLFTELQLKEGEDEVIYYEALYKTRRVLLLVDSWSGASSLFKSEEAFY